MKPSGPEAFSAPQFQTTDLSSSGENGTSRSELWEGVSFGRNGLLKMGLCDEGSSNLDLKKL